jgi:hypothetical protein
LRMGYWKDIRERLGGGNPEAHENEYVCAACVEDAGLKGFIEGEACARCCTFCGAESPDPIAAPLVELLLYVNECLGREYDVAENKLPYESAEGGYIGDVRTTRELLEEQLSLDLPNDHDGRLMDALCDGLGDRVWCRQHPYSLADDEKLSFSWDEFSDLVKHRRRYFFVREHRADHELYSPPALLSELANWCDRFGLVRTLPADHSLFRARFQKPGEPLTSPSDLGPPPQDRATMANRMSPPGIVMLYVSEDKETAVREIAKDPARDVGQYAIGRFRTLRRVKILDLAGIPDIPSIFEPVSDSLEYDPRPPLIFLNYFALDLSKPIARDRSIHVDYVPTQVVTEYFRTEYFHEGERIAGIRYRSARHCAHCSLVLFATQEAIVNGNLSEAESSFPRIEPWIELVGREERDITAEDLDQWDLEAPREFEWV